MGELVTAFQLSNLIVSVVDVIIALCIAIIMAYHGAHARHPHVLWLFVVFFVMKAGARSTKALAWGPDAYDIIVTFDAVIAVFAVIIVIALVTITIEAIRVPTLDVWQQQLDKAQRDKQLLAALLEDKTNMIVLLKEELVRQKATSKYTDTSPLPEIIEQLEKMSNGGSRQ